MKKLRLFAKMLLFIMLPAVLGLCAVSWFSYIRAESSLVRQIHIGLDAVASSQANQLANMARLLRDGLKTAANFTEFKDFLEAAPENREPLQPAMSRMLDRMVTDFPLIKSGGLLDHTGLVIGDTNPLGLGRNFGDRGYFKEGMQGRDAVLNSQNKIDGVVTTMVSCPVMRDGKAIGVLFTMMNAERLYSVTTEKAQLGKTGSCQVYEGSGLLLTHQKGAGAPPDPNSAPWLRQVVSQRNGSLEFEQGGRVRIAYFHDVPEMDWIVLASVDRDEVLAPARALLINNILISLAMTFFVCVIIFVVARNMAGDLRSVSGFVGQVAQGNFAAPVGKALERSAGRSDELGDLTRGINSMVEKLKKLFSDSEEKAAEARAAMEKARLSARTVEQARESDKARHEMLMDMAGQLEEVAGILAHSSDELLRQMQQSNETAGEVSSHLSSAAAAMDQMNRSVRDVAASAGAASEVSAATREKALAGASVVEQSMHSMDEIQKLSLDLKEDMSRLNDHAQDISRIMGVISDIADQTNLLALNAAIEAARAGEAGRGFAVVADEVRKLAEKTMASTADVSQAISRIQESTSRSMGSVDTSVQRIAEAADQARQSGQALQEIVSTVEDTANQVQAIAAASEEQSATSEEVNRSIGQVNEMSRQTAEAMSKAAEEVSLLTRQAQRINELTVKMQNV